MGGLDIDTRSDIYSLGVLLYELLTGTTPIDQKRFLRAAFDEVLGIIRKEEFPRPSTRLSSLGDTASSVAVNRGLDVKRLSQVLAGDLDWVVMKALEKDRGRRYDSASAFADDVERVLARRGDRGPAAVEGVPVQEIRAAKSRTCTDKCHRGNGSRHGGRPSPVASNAGHACRRSGADCCRPGNALGTSGSAGRCGREKSQRGCSRTRI